ncbi:MAG: PDZ domain-containing protein [Burkholderiales bacterium]
MKKTVKLLLSLVTLLAFISGCSTPSTMLINQQGQLYRCAANGWGYVGAPMADSIHRGCVNDMKKVGYVEIPQVSWGVTLSTSAKSPLQVSSVVNDSPAALSGIVVGDIVRELDDQPVHTLFQVYQLLDTKKPGDVLRVRIERNGAIINLTSALRKR